MNIETCLEESQEEVQLLSCCTTLEADTARVEYAADETHAEEIVRHVEWIDFIWCWCAVR